MQFYCKSTEGQKQKKEKLQAQQEPAVSQQATQKLNACVHDTLNPYLIQIMQLSNQLTQELVQNNYLLQLQHLPPNQSPLEKPKEDEKKSITSKTNSGTNSFTFYNSLKNHQEIPSRSPEAILTQKKKARQSQKNIEDKESSSYKPDKEESQEEWRCKISESKNIPKNYGKAIINFIRHNEAFVKQVVAHFCLDFDDFREQIERLKVNLNTILQLRLMWSEGVWAQVLRVITMEYLRKHSLSYIFNSRVENFHKHIKYRYKIVQSVHNPSGFTCMKEF